MTYLRQVCAAAALILILALATFAGDMHTDVKVTSNISVSSQTAFADPVLLIALNILQGALSLL